MYTHLRKSKLIWIAFGGKFPGRCKYAIRGYLQLNLTSMSDCPSDCGLQNQLRFSKMLLQIEQNEFVQLAYTMKKPGFKYHSYLRPGFYI